MRIMFGMFLFAFLGYLVPKNVKQSKFGLVSMHARPLDYLDALILVRAHAPCSHMCVMHA